MLAARGLSFTRGERALLDDATLVVDDGERCALVGRNGAGKSTLLSILAGALAPDAGVVERGRGQRVGALAQMPALDEDARLKDVALAALDPQEGEHRVDEVLSKLSILDHAEKTVRELSGGMRRRLDVARLFLQSPEILLLDEPTNHLDREGIAFLASELKRHRGPVILVSHDRAFVDEVATRIVELENGVIITYAPPGDAQTSLYDAFLEQKLVREEHASRTAHRRARLWVRELAWLRAGTPARTTKQRARIERAHALADDVDLAEQQIRERKARVELEAAQGPRLGKTILAFEDVAMKRGDRVLFEGLSLALAPGDRWGIVGENGAGKTTLLLGVEGKLEPAAGKITRGVNTRIAVFDQHRAVLDPEATLEEILAGEADHVFVGEKRVHIATYLEQFLFEGSDRYRKVKTLSGGQQNRLALARLFQQPANCLLLDEPTNDLDVETLGVLEEALLEHEGCALIVSHDRRFLERVTSGIVVLEDGRATVYRGGVGAWDRQRVDATPVTEKAADTRVRTKRKRSYKEERELAAMEETLMTKEARRDELRATLAGADIYKDPDQARALTSELGSLDGEIESLYARWQELSDLLPM